MPAAATPRASLSMKASFCAFRPTLIFPEPGAPGTPVVFSVFCLIRGRRIFSGPPTGDTPKPKEMLVFWGDYNITADVEVIPIQKVNEAYERLLKSDVKYRFSIDMASL